MSEAGNLFVIAAPSGTGKTSLVKALVDRMQNITVSISYTTRTKRPEEIQEVNYHFVDEAVFKRMIAHGDFLEYATIFDRLYGTSKSWVEATLAKGIDVILEIDWQGNQQIHSLFADAIGIFILPPSLTQLRERLIKRNQDHPDIIEKRLADAKKTLSHMGEFDYVVLNDHFDTALLELETIVSASRLLRKRMMAKYAQVIENMVN